MTNENNELQNNNEITNEESAQQVEIVFEDVDGNEVTEISSMETFVMMMIADKVSEEIGETTIITDIHDSDDEEEIERLTIESEKLVFDQFREVLNSREDLREELEGEELELAIKALEEFMTTFLNVHYQAIGSKLQVGENITLAEIEARNESI